MNHSGCNYCKGPLEEWGHELYKCSECGEFDRRKAPVRLPKFLTDWEDETRRRILRNIFRSEDPAWVGA